MLMDELERLLSDLVSINSINPDLVPGSPGEEEIAHYIADWLKLAGLEVELIESVSGRPNVVGDCARHGWRQDIIAQWPHGYGRCRRDDSRA